MTSGNTPAGLIATPDPTLSALIALGCGTLLGPWWCQVAWLVLVALVELWHQVDAEDQRAHGDGW